MTGPAGANSPARQERVLDWVNAALAEACEEHPHLRAGLEKALTGARRAAKEEGWPPLWLPLRVGTALDLAPQRLEPLGAACVLYFAAADIVDDAQDGHLDPAQWTDWRLAVSAGLTLLFLAQQLALAASPPTEMARVASAFGRSGVQMSLGQCLDLSQHVPLQQMGSEEQFLSCVRLKTGASLALYASLPALCAGARAETVDALSAWGEAVGAALQLSSDVADLLSPTGRDRAAGRATLPIQRAWSRLSAADRVHLEAAWQGRPEAPSLDFLLQRTGALAYVRARIGALKLEAKEAIATPGFPVSLAEDLMQWVDRAGANQTRAL